MMKGILSLTKKYNLALLPVIEAKGENDGIHKPNTEDGILCNSDIFSGLNSKEARDKIIALFEEKGIGQKNYKLQIKRLGHITPTLLGDTYTTYPLPTMWCGRI